MGIDRRRCASSWGRFSGMGGHRVPPMWRPSVSCLTNNGAGQTLPWPESPPDRLRPLTPTPRSARAGAALRTDRRSPFAMPTGCPAAQRRSVHLMPPTGVEARVKPNPQQSNPPGRAHSDWQIGGEGDRRSVRNPSGHHAAAACTAPRPATPAGRQGPGRRSPGCRTAGFTRRPASPQLLVPGG